MPRAADAEKMRDAGALDARLGIFSCLNDGYLCQLWEVTNGQMKVMTELVNWRRSTPATMRAGRRAWNIEHSNRDGVMPLQPALLAASRFV